MTYRKIDLEIYSEQIQEYISKRTLNPLLSVNNFCTEKSLNHSTFCRYLKKLNFDYKQLPKITPKILNSPNAILDGCMLGDGSIFFSDKKNKYPVYSHTSKHKEYLEWLSLELKYLENRPVWESKRFDKRTQKTYCAWWSKSRTSIELLEQKTRWYSSGNKKIPEDLILTPKTILVWYLDDGCLQIKPKNGRQQFFSCNDFIEEDIDKLVNLFIDTTSIPVYKYDKRIYTPAKYIDSLLDFIGPPPVSCFRYKWNS